MKIMKKEEEQQQQEEKNEVEDVNKLKQEIN